MSMGVLRPAGVFVLPRLAYLVDAHGDGGSEPRDDNVGGMSIAPA